MKFSTYIILVTLFMTYQAVAQVGIGTTSPKGMLDVTATNTGLVLPRVANCLTVTAVDGGTPEKGTVVFDTGRNALCYYVNNRWMCNGLTSEGNFTTYLPYDQKYTYFKASNTDLYDYFGSSVALSNDGLTLAVGSNSEDSNATGINGNQFSNTALSSGAVYIFKNTGGVWAQEAYIKSSNSEASDGFGVSVGLSENGNTLVVGAYNEASNATGVNGNETDNSIVGAGAAYVFERAGATWSQTTYLKASNTETTDNFGFIVEISGNANTIGVVSRNEDSSATGINGNQGDNGALNSGAVYVFTRSGGTWVQQAYIKQSNTDANDSFGRDISINYDGSVLAVGATSESSNATGVNGNQADNSEISSGAVYLFKRVGAIWSQQAYLKSNNSDSGDLFGWSVDLSGIGDILAVGAIYEDSDTSGVNSIPTNTPVTYGAVYVFQNNAGTWGQDFYIKPNYVGGSDGFGYVVRLNEDATSLVVGASSEDSKATGINGDTADDTSNASGCFYKFDFGAATWMQTWYAKASNTDNGDFFGRTLAISADGSKVVSGANSESSNATGINGEEFNNFSSGSGAVYLIEN